MFVDTSEKKRVRAFTIITLGYHFDCIYTCYRDKLMSSRYDNYDRYCELEFNTILFTIDNKNAFQ